VSMCGTTAVSYNSQNFRSTGPAHFSRSGLPRRPTRSRPGDR
jgi:hypothetical protein